MAAETTELALATTPDRLKYLLLQELVRRCNEQMATDPLWLELVNRPTERSSARMHTLLTQHRDWKAYEIPLKIVTNRAKRETMVLTPLTASLLFERWDVLERWFDHLWTKECRVLNRIYKPSRLNLQSSLTLWLALDRWKILEPLWHKLKKYGHQADLRRTVATHVGRILTVIHRFRQFDDLCQYLMDQAAAALSPKAHRTFSDFFECCTRVVRGYLQQPLVDQELMEEDGELRDVRDTLTGARFVPPLPKSLDDYIARWPASELQGQHPSGWERIVWERVYHRLITSPGHKEVQRWSRSHLPRLLAFMDHKIRPFLTSLLPRRPRVRRVIQTLDRAHVFRVHRSQCTYEFLNAQHCLVKFGTYQFVLDRHTYEISPGAYWIVLLHGATVTPATHPWICQHVARYQGHVPRLRFGLTRSDGMIWPIDEVTPFYPQLLAVPDAPLHDLTSLFGLRKTTKNCTRGTERDRKPAVPFAEACVLTRQQLQGIASLFAQWSAEQRYLFYFMFWNLDGTTRLPYDAVCPAFGQTWISMLEDTMDWTQGQDLRELRTWIPLPKLDAQQLQMRSLFWSRWQFWLPRTALHVQALALFQSTKSPLLLLTELMPAPLQRPVTRTLMGEVCRLSHRLENVWLPLMVPAQLSAEGAVDTGKRLLGLLLAPDFPSELRRLVWQSLHNLPIYGTGRLQRGHPFFPDRVYPVMTAEEVQTLPRLFVKFQNDWLVPDQSVSLLFSRAEALAVDVTLLEAVAAQLQDRAVVHTRQVELGFVHEPGRGPSVMAEVLTVLWQSALRDGVIRVLDEDNTVCVVEGAHPEHHRRLYELGLVSALCIHRGYHLPYPLHTGWWRSLVTDWESDVFTLCQIFPEWAEPRLHMIRNLTTEQRRTTFADLVSQDPDSLTDEELVQICFLPQRDALEAFVSGWNVCMNHVDLGPVLPHLNGMFCETQRLDITVANLERVLSVHHGNDYVFLEAVKQLSTDQLQRLVQFITGKARLPVLERSEDRIRVVWGGPGASTLPRAQNCTNTLLMPDLPTPLTPNHVLDCLRSLFEFDTVYGFL